MRFGLFEKHAAKNSAPVWRALRQGLHELGFAYGSEDTQADVAIIWSQVWAGRMQANREIWQQFTETRRPVIVAEVGMLRRGVTWKLGINGTGSRALWGDGLDRARPQQLGLTLQPWTCNVGPILICLQRWDSEQWRGQPPTAQWLSQTVAGIRQVTSREILVRPHPRQRVAMPAGVSICAPQRVPNTYDNFDFDTAVLGSWAVVNWNSGPGSQAIMQGIPAFVGPTSLAAPVANLDLGAIESPRRPAREDWLCSISHTEWTVEEIATGLPLRRLLPALETF